MRVTAELLDRLPPADDEAERLLVGSLLAQPSWCDDALAGVTPDVFRQWHLRTIWQAIAELHAEGQPIDVASVGERLSTSHRLVAVGGAKTLLGLLWCGQPGYTDHFARRVIAAAARREAARVGCDVVKQAYGDAAPDAIRAAGEWLVALADSIGMAPRRPKLRIRTGKDREAAR